MKEVQAVRDVASDDVKTSLPQGDDHLAGAACGLPAFTLPLCYTDLPLILLSPAACEAAILEDGIYHHYFAATRETH
jgi:hypothetical protein